MTPALTFRSTRFSVLRWLALSLAVLAAPFLSACGYNDFQSKDEATKAAWAEVINQYQRRADLIPNLVNTVKGYASHERETLEAVTRARAAATSIQVTPETLNDPAAFQKFQQAQGAVAPDGGVGKLSAAQGRCVVPRSAIATGRHREPHHRGAPALHQVGAGLQRAGPQLPDQPDGQGDGLPSQAELHGREREGHLHRAGGEVLTG
jgi:hypothetical protein